MARPSQAEVRQAILDANVWQHGHVVLSSGQHSDIKLEMDRIAKHARAIALVARSVSEIVKEHDVQAIVPVPDGAVTIADATHLKSLIAPQKVSSREFDFTDRDKGQLKRLGHVAILEDVVTTAGTSAALTDQIHDFAPNTDIELIGIWCRGSELNLRRYMGAFADRTYLVEEEILAWSAFSCVGCPFKP